MELIVISSEVEVLNEIDDVNNLFINGLNLFHLRKSNTSEEIYKRFLKSIDSKFHGRIVLHDHHQLLNEFGLKGIHLKEAKRKEIEKNLKSFKAGIGFLEKQHSISSSFHSKEAISGCSIDFDYMFLSPVFDSISKDGYVGKRFDVSEIASKTIALGGISENNIHKAKKLGYRGVAVLGSIWKTQNPLSEFKKIQNICKST